MESGQNQQRVAIVLPSPPVDPIEQVLATSVGVAVVDLIAPALDDFVKEVDILDQRVACAIAPRRVVELRPTPSLARRNPAVGAGPFFLFPTLGSPTAMLGQ